MVGLLCVGAMGFTFSQMHRTRELVAIMAAGVPLRRCVWAVVGAALALNLLAVDQQGFDHMDRRLLLAMIEKFDGGPVGVESLAAAIGEERGTIEDVLEPYLIQQGYMLRTPRGRMATRAAWLHFGLQPLRAPANMDLLGQTDGEP